MQETGIAGASQALAAASEAVGALHDTLCVLIEKASEEMVAGLGELRRLRVESAELARRISEVEDNLARCRSSELAVEIVGLREQQQALRQHEERLMDAVEEWRGAVRRLQLALQTGEAVAASLVPSAPVPDCGSLAGEAWRVAQAQEDERQRLSREIHDGPAQALANVIFELEFCQRLLDKDPEKLRKELERLKTDMRQALADVRHFIFGLRPAGLAELGLATTVRRYVEDYADRWGMRLVLDVDDAVRLNGNQEVAIFRIIQEALQNTRKHAKATEVKLRLRAEGDDLVIRVEDNGEGFDKAKLQTIGHFGLRGMQERARLIGARLEIDSQQGAGTTVTVIVQRRDDNEDC